jgi:hypothetical protein
MKNNEQANQVADALLIGDKHELELKYAKHANEISQTYRSSKLMALPTVERMTIYEHACYLTRKESIVRILRIMPVVAIIIFYASLIFYSGGFFQAFKFMRNYPLPLVLTLHACIFLVLCAPHYYYYRLRIRKNIREVIADSSLD